MGVNGVREEETVKEKWTQFQMRFIDCILHLQMLRRDDFAHDHLRELQQIVNKSIVFCWYKYRLSAGMQWACGNDNNLLQFT